VAGKSLSEVLNKRTLVRLASGESFEQGRRTFFQGRVKALKESDGVLAARVRGADWYDVKLWVVNETLVGSCTCSSGRCGQFCGHCVAAGAAWIVSRGLSADEPVASGSAEAIRKYLDEIPKKKLVDMLMAQAKRDGAFRQKLARAAARSRSSEPDFGDLRYEIEQATRVTEPWHVMGDRDRVRKLEPVLDALGRKLLAGDAAGVRELAQLGLESIAEAAGGTCDPDSGLGQVADQFLSLHRRACEAAGPDPIELARWVFDFERSYTNRAYDGTVFRYLEPLGERGLVFYRKLAEGGWRESKRAWEPYSPAKRARAEAMANNAALLAVDPALMAEISPDGPDSPWLYYHCANRCLEASLSDKAVAWAELGVKAFPDRPYEALHRILADEYVRRGQTTEALNQVWATFTCVPAMENYTRLEKLAKKAGQAAVWRDEALEYVKERAARSPKPAPGDESENERLRCGSLIVEILLKEKDVDAAWREAQTGGCYEGTWIKLARVREEKHPADAIRVYQQFAERVVQGGGDDGYRAAVRYLRRAADIIARLGQSGNFREYLRGYRERNKRKKRLLWLLDREFDLG
jgi:uncharacterized Zn finger protein